MGDLLRSIRLKTVGKQARPWRYQVVVTGMRKPPVQIWKSSARATCGGLLALVLLAACAQTPDTSDITTSSIGASSTNAEASDLPPSVPGEGLEARLARLEYDLAQLKLDYSIVRPSFEQLVSRESELTDRLAAIEGALGPVTASIPTARKPAAKTTPQAPKPAPAMPATTASVAPSGAVGLHLASYRNLDRLKEGWAELKATHPAELTGLEVRVQRIDTGKNGVFRRLLAGPVNSRTAADGLCRALSAKGVYCKTVTFSGSAL